MDDIYKNIEEYNSNKKRKTLIVFNEMIADSLNVIITDFLYQRQNVQHFFAFIMQSYVTVPKNITLTSIHYQENLKKTQFSANYF